MDNTVQITKNQLLVEVQNMHYEGYRFITASCVDNGDATFDVLYHFDHNLELKNIRVTLDRDEEIESISKIYFCAFMVENEMKELFGLKVTNISIDYEGHLLLSKGAPDTPMAGQITIVKKGEE